MKLHFKITPTNIELEQEASDFDKHASLLQLSASKCFEGGAPKPSQFEKKMVFFFVFGCGCGGVVSIMQGPIMLYGARTFLLRVRKTERRRGGEEERRRGGEEERRRERKCERMSSSH